MNYLSIIYATLACSFLTHAMDIEPEPAQSINTASQSISPALQALIKHGMLCDSCKSDKALVAYLTEFEATYGKQELRCNECAHHSNYQIPIGGLLQKIKAAQIEKADMSCDICYESIHQEKGHLNGVFLSCCATQEDAKILCTQCNFNTKNQCPYCRNTIKAIALQKNIIDTIKQHIAKPFDTQQILNNIYHNALTHDDVETVSSCLQHGMKPVPLHACQNFQILKLMLEHRADVAFRTKDGKTPLHTHVASTNPSIARIALLLQWNADVNARSFMLATPLHGIANPEYDNPQKTTDIAELLIAHSADCNAQDKWGNTPLHNACTSGNISAVRTLLCYGALMHIQNRKGTSPYDIAESQFPRTLIPIMKPLLTKQPIPAKNQPTAFLRILDEIDLTNNVSLPDVVKSVGTCPMKTHGYLLKYAIKRKKYSYADALFSCSYGQPNPDENLKELLANPKTKLDDMTSYLALVNINGNFLGTIEQAAKCIDYLVQQGANLNCKLSDGQTPLYAYVKSNACLLVKNLLAYGARADIESPTARSPLHWAQTGQMASLLIEQGNANVNAHNNNSGLTPLHVAATNGHNDVIETLIKHGANMNIQDSYYQETPLHLATARGNMITAELLIKSGAQHDISNYNGQRPTDKATTDADQNSLLNSITIHGKTRHTS